MFFCWDGVSAGLINSLSTKGNLHSCFLAISWPPSLIRGQVALAKDVAGKINGHETECSPWGIRVSHPLGFLHQGTSWEGPHEPWSAPGFLDVTAKQSSSWSKYSNKQHLLLSLTYFIKILSLGFFS